MKPKRGRPRGSKNHVEKVLVRSTRSRRIQLSAEALSITVGRAKQAEDEKRRTLWAGIKGRKEAWLRYVSNHYYIQV
jgi:hypothetical protein